MRRLAARLRAWWGGWFWLPCPNCGRYFGGHEVNTGHVLETSRHGGFATCSHRECFRDVSSKNLRRWADEIAAVRAAEALQPGESFQNMNTSTMQLTELRVREVISGTIEIHFEGVGVLFKRAVDIAVLETAIKRATLGLFTGLQLEAQPQLESAQAPFTWWWGHGEEAEIFYPADSREHAITEARAACEGFPMTIGLARPATLRDDIFNYEDVMEEFREWNEEAADEDGELKQMDATPEQRSELEAALAATLAAWRVKHGIGRAHQLEFKESEVIDVPAQESAQ